MHIQLLVYANCIFSLFYHVNLLRWSHGKQQQHCPGLEKTTSRVLKEDPLIVRNQMGKEILVSLLDSKHLVLLDETESKFTFTIICISTVCPNSHAHVCLATYCIKWIRLHSCLFCHREFLIFRVSIIFCLIIQLYTAYKYDTKHLMDTL